MRDLHIEALVRQYGGEEGKELAECPVVREYRCSISICICISSLGGIGCEVKHVVKKALSFLVFLCGLIFPAFFLCWVQLLLPHHSFPHNYHHLPSHTSQIFASCGEQDENNASPFSTLDPIITTPLFPIPTQLPSCTYFS